MSFLVKRYENHLKIGAVLIVLGFIASCYIAFFVNQQYSSRPKQLRYVEETSKQKYMVDADAPLEEGVVVAGSSSSALRIVAKLANRQYSMIASTINNMPSENLTAMASITGVSMTRKNHSSRMATTKIFLATTFEKNEPTTASTKAFLATTVQKNGMTSMKKEVAQAELDQRLRKTFAPALTEVEHAMYVNTLRGCVEIMENAGFTFFLYAGSLIGWYRHNRRAVPWDDDMDIALLPTFSDGKDNVTFYMEKLQQEADRPAFLDKYGKFRLNEQGGMKLKCNSASPVYSKSIGRGYKWRWPFLDIHLMKTYYKWTKKPVYELRNMKVSSSIIVEDPRDSSFSYSSKWIFPLKNEKFEDVPVPVPSQPAKVLKLTYDVSVCEAMWYNHRREVIHRSWDKVTRVNCSDIAHFVNFSNLE